MMARKKEVVEETGEAIIKPVEPITDMKSFEEAYKKQNPKKYPSKKAEGQFDEKD